MAVTASVMMQMNDNARRTLVVGLGKTGLSVARYLSRQGVEVAVVDLTDTAGEHDRFDPLAAAAVGQPQTG